MHSGRDLPPGNHASIEIEVPDVVTSVSLGLSQLPPGWDEVPDIDRAKVIGDQWFDRMEGLLLCVPSVASAGDFNYLINQQHPEFGRLRPSDPAPVDWDSRLLK